MVGNTLSVAHGANDKPVATSTLVADLRRLDVEGYLTAGYPVIASPDGSVTIDALLVSPQLGVLAFDLIEGTDTGDFEIRQDESVNLLTARLLKHRNLMERRRLAVPIEAVSYAPAVSTPHSTNGEIPALHGTNSAVLDQDSSMNGAVLNRDNIRGWIDQRCQSEDLQNFTPALYERTLSALQSISRIRRAGSPRAIRRNGSKGSILVGLEKSISTLDRQQNKAVIETVEGVQRIRGLAGSGKTIVLALKAAYLHARYPEWRMAITFSTRSLKAYYKRLINTFVIDQTSAEPDWQNIQVMNAWGAPGAPERNGVYYEFCRANDVEYLDFRTAKQRFGWDHAFKGAVDLSLNRPGEDKAHEPVGLYDVILIDEAQDLPPNFLRLCFQSLRPGGRLVYAYDELQNLTNTGLPPVEEIFGSVNGEPLVQFGDDSDTGNPQRDIILDKCYRNSRPILVTAHGLGFGIYRTPEESIARLPGLDRSSSDMRFMSGAEHCITGLVQMFEEVNLWNEIGYRTQSGTLALGEEVKLARTSETSPKFLENHSPLDDIIEFRVFPNETAQAAWIAQQIEKNLNDDELHWEDIMVINTNPLSTRSKMSKIRVALLDRGIQSHLAGVDTTPDEFFQSGSITCSGIHRAKGNEAAMVYVANADECERKGLNLAGLRNRLFTAITRSKAWVKVTGVGSDMESILREFEKIKNANFSLEFRYPSESALKHLRVIHRDMSPGDRKRLEQRKTAISSIIRDLREGNLFIEDFEANDLDALAHFLKNR